MGFNEEKFTDDRLIEYRKKIYRHFKKNDPEVKFTEKDNS